MSAARQPEPYAMAAVPVLAVAGIGKTYGADADAVPAVMDFDFTINRGEFVSVIGPSGCGKSPFST